MQTVDGSPDVEEQPVLWLGMFGFDEEQRSLLEFAVAGASTPSRWRLSDLNQADAWCVNGAQARLMLNGHLELASPQPDEKPLKINMSEVDRPVAFAEPLLAEELEALCTFDPDSVASAHAVLLQFEIRLRLLRAQFLLGKSIIGRGTALRHSIQHVYYQSCLLAVLNFRTGQAGLNPHLHPDDLQHAHWEKRPVGAGEPPTSFIGATIGQLSWTYALRTDHNMLPERYRTSAIFYRHAPRVPPSWLRDSQLMLLRELIIGPGSLNALCERTGLSREQAERDLACLYYAGAITATPAKAARTGLDGAGHGHADFSFATRWSPSGDHIRVEVTAPAGMKRH